MGKIYIILPVHNRIAHTLNFIEDLNKQTYKDFSLVLVDDKSTDGTCEKVEKAVENVIVLKGNGNLWWGGALQLAYKWFSTRSFSPDDIVLIINNDLRFNERFLSIAIKILSDNPRSLVLSHSFDINTGELIDAGIHIDWRHLKFIKSDIHDKRLINCLSTRGLFLHMNDFLYIGNFHPILLPHFFSDYEYTHRAYRKGYLLLSSEELKVFVDQSSTWNVDKNKLTILNNVKTFFSKKNPSNPFYLSFFIMLCCPARWKFINICKVWIEIPIKIFKYIRTRYLPNN